MNAGRWMTIEQAFARAVEIEGVPEIAFTRFFTALRSGEIEAVVARRCTSMSEGGVKSFKPNDSLWNSLAIDLSHGDLHVEEHTSSDGEDTLYVGPELFTLSQWRICVDRESLDRALKQGAVETASEQSLSARPAPQTDKKRGGRPTTYDWPEAAGFLAGYVVEHDYPSVQADLSRELKDWFVARQQSPDDGELGKFVRVMYKTRGK